MVASVDRNRKFSEPVYFQRVFFNSCNIQGFFQGFFKVAIFKAFWLTAALFSSIFFKILDFALAVSFYSSRRDIRVKFDSGVLFLDQSQFFVTQSKQ